MATATPPQVPQANSAPSATEQQQRYRQLLRYTAVGALVACPVVIAMPPRKLDVYTLGLLVAMGVSANHVAREYTGMSLTQRAVTRVASLAPQDLPSEKAREVQKRLKAERAAQLAARAGQGLQIESSGPDGKVLAALAQQEDERAGGAAGSEKKDRGVLSRIWMGDEDDDWKAKRDAKEKRALEEGKGYGDLITEQIWEVWNWGRNKTEAIKEKDEQVLVEAKKEEEKR